MWLILGQTDKIAVVQAAQALKVTLTRFQVAALALVLAACSSISGPEYSRPEVATKQSWSQSDATLISGADTIRPDWWRNFGDPLLDELIATALDNNLDLRILAARVGVAEANTTQANATRLPTLDSALGASFQKAEGGDVSRSVSHATALGWEVDIWGKLKKGVAAQSAEYRASEADWRAGYLSLVSNVSNSYFLIRQYDEQLARQVEAIQKSQAILAIFQAQFEEGLSPQTQVIQQQAEVNNLETDYLELQRLRKLTENSLATLLGIPAGDFSLPTQSLSDAVNFIVVPGGLPADLLSRRPDIVAAEYRVLKAYELVGQARLAQLPGISLTSNAGNTSADLGALLKSWVFGLTPAVSIPIFDPNVRARIKVSEAQSTLAEEQYRAVVMRAFEEVENELTNLSNRRKQRQQLLTRQQNLQLVNAQVKAQLEEGIVTQLQVFESERSLLATELALLENRQLILNNTVALYKALGGGWAAEDVAAQNSTMTTEMSSKTSTDIESDTTTKIE